MLTTWGSSSLISPNSAYVKLCLATDCYTPEGLDLFKAPQMVLSSKENKIQVPYNGL